MDLSPEPDLHPLYPTPGHIAPLLSPHSGLAPSQKTELVAHCITRACLFGDISVLSYLLGDHEAQLYVDLGIRDEDGVGLVSLTIHGFGAECERDVEREECVRLLIAQGADLSADKAGWTPLHYAALLSPPTLISYLMTHDCSPFDVTRRNLTALDIVTAHSPLPGRDDVALLLEEAMRGEGWSGGRMEDRRRLLEERMKRSRAQRNVRNDVGSVLGVNPTWWGVADSDSSSIESESDDESEDHSDGFYTPPLDYSSMLVFSPLSLPQIFESLITNFQPLLRNSQPANTLYLLARFACLMCDHTWLEDLIIGATDAIEDTFFNRAEDVTCLVFWLYNTTVWLHLMQCDNSINEACELLGSFELIEEVINSIFVFIIRFAERRIDQLLDTSLLDHSPLSSEFESVQFESEWSFLRPFTGKKKPTDINPASANSIPLRTTSPTPPSCSRPPSPSMNQATISSSSSKGFLSLRQTFARARAPSAPPLHSMFSEQPRTPSPSDLTSFLTALHTFLTHSDINPVLTTQLWSQVMYWTSCEMFNRILTRKKYLCRSRAVQIGMNVGALEEWVGQMGLPRGVQSHFVPVRELLNWLQCLSSIREFPSLVDTIQTMKSINPLQMRRAVRDYKFEVNEGRMTDECVQYLTQLQKDWERHRVKLGVEALRKEIGDRDRRRDGSVSSYMNDSPDTSATHSVSAQSPAISAAQRGIDKLFEKSHEKSTWEPAKPPQVLGELLDSRYMLPLLFPSDPRMLSASPGKHAMNDDGPQKRRSAQLTAESRSASRASAGSRGTMVWRLRNRKLREVGIETLQQVDGVRSAARWGRPVALGDDEDDEDEDNLISSSSDDLNFYKDELKVDTNLPRSTPLTRKPSARSRKQSGAGDNTPIERP